MKYHPGHVWHLLERLGFSCQQPSRRALERNEPEIRRWQRHRWPAFKKARRAARTIVFIDESGLSTRPHRVRTWGRKGQTPCSRKRSTGSASP